MRLQRAKTSRKDVQGDAGWFQDARNLRHRHRIVLDVFEHLVADHHVEGVRLERDAVVRRIDRAKTSTERSVCGKGEVTPVGVKAFRHQVAHECTVAAAEVENRRAFGKPCAATLKDPGELRRRSPIVRLIRASRVAHGQ
jgi:hypothetical protein